MPTCNLYVQNCVFLGPGGLRLDVLPSLKTSGLQCDLVFLQELLLPSP